MVAGEFDEAHQENQSSIPLPIYNPTSDCGLVPVAMVRRVPIRIILVGAQVLLVVLLIHPVGVFLGMPLGLELVIFVHALGLGQAVDLAADKTSNGFFGEGVADRFAWISNVSIYYTGRLYDVREAYPSCAGGPQTASWLRRRRHPR